MSLTPLNFDLIDWALSIANVVVGCVPLAPWGAWRGRFGGEREGVAGAGDRFRPRARLDRRAGRYADRLLRDERRQK